MRKISGPDQNQDTLPPAIARTLARTIPIEASHKSLPLLARRDGRLGLDILHNLGDLSAYLVIFILQF